RSNTSGCDLWGLVAVIHLQNTCRGVYKHARRREKERRERRPGNVSLAIVVPFLTVIIMPRPFSAIDSSAHDLGIDQTVALSRGNSSTSAMNNPRRKTRQYSTEYLKYGFIRAPGNKQLPMCMMCEKVFSNEAMKPSRLKEHLMRKRSRSAARCRVSWLPRRELSMTACSCRIDWH
ncbi:hypothetical protein M514_26226, partial [Trichuris suis]